MVSGVRWPMRTRGMSSARSGRPVQAVRKVVVTRQALGQGKGRGLRQRQDVERRSNGAGESPPRGPGGTPSFLYVPSKASLRVA